jgi:hypothetical protein
VIKRLHGQLATEEDFIKRFRHEATIAVAVDSPYVAKVFDAGRVGETLYIAMEYLAGWTISRLISDLIDSDTQASVSSVVDIVADALLGLDALHTAKASEEGSELGIVHRDIAPKNIMVCEDGKTRLIDLGLGKSKLQDWKTATGVIMGSPGYMAPEQVTSESLDRRADLYAMGIVLWELLTRDRYIKRGPLPVMLRAQLAPSFVPPSQHRADTPPALDDLLRKALALEPDDRFQSAREMHAALTSVLKTRKKEDTIHTLIGGMLWGELGKAKTELTNLVALPPTEPNEPAREEVVVFAERTGARHVPAEPTPLAMPSLVAQAPRPGVPIKTVLMLMLVMLAIGLGAGALLLGREAEPIVAKPVASALPAHSEPAQAPTPAPPAAEPDLGPRVAKSAPSDPEAPAHRPRRALHNAPLPHEAKAEPAPHEAKLEPAPRSNSVAYDSAQLNALIRRARQLKANAPDGRPKDRASSVLVSLMKEAGAGDLAPATARIRTLEAEIEALEKESKGW